MVKESRAASKFRGVSRSGGGWQARIRVNGEQKYLGRFQHEEDAAKAFDDAAIAFHAERAILNFGPNGPLAKANKPKVKLRATMGLKKKGISRGVSKFRGVTKNGKGWQARIRVNGQQKYLGRFDTEAEAAACFDEAAKRYHGDKAILNFVPKASPYRGVTRSGKGWQARIRVDGIQRYLGRFKTQEEAARAFDDAARRFHGDKATLNFDLNSPMGAVGNVNQQGMNLGMGNGIGGQMAGLGGQMGGMSSNQLGQMGGQQMNQMGAMGGQQMQQMGGMGGQQMNQMGGNQMGSNQMGGGQMVNSMGGMGMQQMQGLVGHGNGVDGSIHATL